MRSSCLPVVEMELLTPHPTLPLPLPRPLIPHPIDPLAMKLDRRRAVRGHHAAQCQWNGVTVSWRYSPQQTADANKPSRGVLPLFAACATSRATAALLFP
jgi:hypothetical protein